ncbi:MAG: hypothetical protein RLZZ502_965, partial [Pseudomonadota bacterium]
GIIPAGLEMMDKLATRAVEDFVHAGYDLEAEAILLCEADGTPDEVAAEIAQVEAVLRRAGAKDIKLSDSEDERLRYWSGRKNAFPAVGRISPDYYCMDGTIPRKALPQVLQKIEQLSKDYDLPCANVFHAGDGNLHPLILFDASLPGALEKTERFGADILSACVAVGGTITGEHGVGKEKIDAMCEQFGHAELARFHDIKSAFDPLRLLNPDKAVPLLHRCAELGGMRMQAALQQKHPTLPRF